MQPHGFDPRQEMGQPDFELQYKRDTWLRDVELHHHDFYELFFLMTGDVTYTIESRLYHVLPGDMLLISPRELHQLCIRPEESAYERYVLWLKPALLRRLSTEETDLSQCFDTGRPGYGNLLRMKSASRTKILSLLEMLYQESEQERFGTAMLQESLLVQFLITLNRLVAQGDTRLEDPPGVNHTVTQVIDYINLHYGDPLTLGALADRFYVSKYHLSHEFQRQVGTGVYRYIQKKRLLIARQLMAQGFRPGQVYENCGFGDYAGFYRAFKAEYGTAPREYALSVRQRKIEE